MRRQTRLWWRTLKLSWSTQRALTTGTLTVMALSVAVTPLSALALCSAINAILDGDRHGALWAAALAALAYALLYVLQDATATLRNAATSRVARLQIEPLVHHNIATLPGLDHLERTDYLDRLKIVRDGAGQVVGSMWRAILTASSVVKITISAAMLDSVSPLLMPLLVLAAVPMWCQHRGQKLLRSAQTRSAQDARLEQALADLAVDPGAGREIRVGGTGPALLERQTAAFASSARIQVRAQSAAARLRLLGWSVFLAGFIGSVVWLAESAIKGRGSIGGLVLAVTVAGTLHQTIQVAVNSAVAVANAGAVIEPYLWLEEHAAKARAQADGLPAPALLQEGIRLEGVDFTYPGTTRPALIGLTATLPAGKVVAVVGEFGSGKSTLVKLLAKLYDPDSGRILVDGTDLAQLDVAGWRAESSAAFQDFGRFELTFAQSVGIGELADLDDPDRIRAALEAAECADITAKLPDGLDTQLGRSMGGVELSEGQWQRVALARASMRRRQLLFLLDEPTASLDALAERDIVERCMVRARAIAAATGGVTVIVSHRFSTVSNADLILVLDHGRLVECGSHADLMARPGQYAKLYQMQVDAYADHRIDKS